MPQKPTDTEENKDQGLAPERDTSAKTKKWLWLKIMAAVLVVLGVLLYVPILNWLPFQLGPGGKASDRKLGPLFTRVPASQLFSTDKTLQSVGRSPVDPSRVLFPSFDKSSSPGVAQKDASGTASTTVSSTSGEKPTQSDADGQGSGEPGPSAPPGTGGGPPAVELRSPVATAPSDPDVPAKRIEAHRPEAPAQRYEDRGKPVAEVVLPSRKGTSPADPAVKLQSTATTEPARTDQFQVPGSLLVKIQNYSGTQPKWGIMVILDDSASMARKRRIWNPNRMEAAVTLIQKLPEAVTAGSKIAVRDFLCKKSDAASSQAGGSCLSHKMYDWHEAPFASLKDNLKQVGPAGSTKPCAAAAFSLARDFASLGGLSPRILIVTDGAAKCPYQEVLKAAEAHLGKDRVNVDVVALGMHRKRHSGYAQVAERSHGVLYRLDGPGDVDTALTRYGKTLKTPIMEKIEVRGDKTVLTGSPEEEIALAPGTYTVLLPAVAGITASKRSVEGVTIRSGEVTLVQIKVKKGRPVAKIGKK